MDYNLELLKKPIPFSSGNMNLWDNEYIARNVLKKHLNYSIDSGSRKLETIYKTVEWINEKFLDAVNILESKTQNLIQINDCPLRGVA